MSAAKLQPAFLAGIAIAVLSVLPVVSVVNACCCAWVIFGGALASYLMQQNHPLPVSVGDGALVGLLAGAMGGAMSAMLAIPIALAMGPLDSAFIDVVLQRMPDLPPEARESLEQLRGRTAGELALPVAIAGAFFWSIVYAAFGMVGGLLGVVMFRKNVPPPPPPPIPPPVGYEPPSFTPPPPPPVT